jgi:hypothetical protein
MSSLEKSTSVGNSNLFETRYAGNRWSSQPEVIKKWDDAEIAKVIVALRERCFGTEEISRDRNDRCPWGIFLKPDNTITMDSNIDNIISVLAFACFRIKDFKLTELMIRDNSKVHEVNLEKPSKMASDIIVARGENHAKQSFEEIRNGVRSAIREYCVNSQELNLRQKGLFIRANGSYTLNQFEDNTTYLGQIYYKVENFNLTRIAIGLGFENAPQFRAAFEGHDV